MTQLRRFQKPLEKLQINRDQIFQWLSSRQACISNNLAPLKDKDESGQIVIPAAMAAATRSQVERRSMQTAHTAGTCSGDVIHIDDCRLDNFEVPICCTTYRKKFK